jgi:uncharacterized protein YdhG (YjbR/CyaY superfamily)
MKPSFAPKSVEAYIADAPKASQAKLNEMRTLIKKLVPDATELISYGMPGYKLNDRPLVYFGGYKEHIGLYAANGSFVQEHPELLEGLETSKGTIKLPLDKPLPVSLITKLLKIRVEENLAK